ncbi:MAG: F0F1 ATP synthase subunit B [Planctomycetota bacterium]
MSSRRFSLSLLFLVLFGFFASLDLAFASGGDGPEFDFRKKVFYLEPGLMIWTIVTFLVLLAVLKTLAWGPILTGLKNREERIRKDLERAEAAWKEAEEKAKALVERLDQAKAEALAIIEEGRADAQKLKISLLAEAETESTLVRERAKKEIELAKKQALQEIWDQTAEISTQLASKILEKELSAQAHQELVKNYLQEYQKVSV